MQRCAIIRWCGRYSRSRPRTPRRRRCIETVDARHHLSGLANQWGQVHHGYFPHSLAGLQGVQFGDIGPVPLGGSGATVLNTQYRINDARAMVGASFRMVLDVGGWDNCQFINAPGQSGNPALPGYQDHVGTWAGGDYFPLVYSDAAVDANTVLTVRLVP